MSQILRFADDLTVLSRLIFSLGRFLRCLNDYLTKRRIVLPILRKQLSWFLVIRVETVPPGRVWKLGNRVYLS